MNACIGFDRAKFTSLVNEHLQERGTRDAIFDLLAFSCKHALKVVGGTGNGSFLYKVATRKGSATLFWCDSFGGVGVSMQNFPQAPHAAVVRFARGLALLTPGFAYLARFEDTRTVHHFSIKETLVDPHIMEGFQDAILDLQTNLARW